MYVLAALLLAAVGVFALDLSYVDARLVRSLRSIFRLLLRPKRRHPVSELLQDLHALQMPDLTENLHRMERLEYGRDNEQLTYTQLTVSASLARSLILAAWRQTTTRGHRCVRWFMVAMWASIAMSTALSRLERNTFIPTTQLQLEYQKAAIVVSVTYPKEDHIQNLQKLERQWRSMPSDTSFLAIAPMYAYLRMGLIGLSLLVAFWGFMAFLNFELFWLRRFATMTIGTALTALYCVSAIRPALMNAASDTSSPAPGFCWYGVDSAISENLPCAIWNAENQTTGIRRVAKVEALVVHPILAP